MDRINADVAEAGQLAFLVLKRTRQGKVREPISIENHA